MATQFAPAAAALPNVRRSAPVPAQPNGIVRFFNALFDSVAEARVMMQEASRKYPFIEG